MIRQEDEKVLILSSLLHDIGKLIQRASKNPKEKKHEEFGAEFLRETLNLSPEIKEEVIKIVKAHHKIPYDGSYPNLLKIVKDADGESAAHDRDESEGIDEKINQTPLLSVFSYVDIGMGSGNKKYHIARILEKTNLPYPEDFSKAKNNRKVYEEIKISLEKYLKNLIISGKDEINTLLYILKKHLRYIPSAVYISVPDIPLYDHLKTTAAIALCKYRSTSSKKYTLIMGDISGIQNFIFHSLKGGEAQAVDEHGTKRMRGRSVMVNLIADSAVKYILEELDLYEFNVLWQSGGNFLLLVPTTDTLDEKLKEIRKNINSFLLEKLGHIFVNIVWKSYSSLNNFSKILEDMHNEMNKEKSRKLVDFVRDEEFYLRRNVSKYICPACGIHPVNSPDEVCEICKSMEKIGEKIVKSKYLIRNLTSEGDFSFEYGDLKIAYTFSNDADENGEVFCIDAFNLPFSGKVRGFKFLKMYVPSENGSVMSISDMVKINDIVSKLGVFKADVDCLGEIFAHGLKGEQKDRVSISRITMLSFLMNVFFTTEINNIAKKHNVYVIFSGGDDLTAVGRYDNIVSFAMDVTKEFRKWNAENKNIHLSASIIFFNEKFPIRRAVEIADESLEEAKNPKYEIDKCVDRGNRVSIFDHIITWENLEEQVLIGQKLYRMQQNGKLASSFSHYLLKLHRFTPEMYATKPLKRGDLIIPSPIPYIKYYFGRRKVDDEIQEIVDKLSQREIFQHIPVGVSLWVMDRKYKKEVS